MNTGQFFFSGRHLITEIIFLAKELRRLTRETDDAYWLGLSFLLFLALGPFSAIAVVAGVGSLARFEGLSLADPPAAR